MKAENIESIFEEIKSERGDVADIHLAYRNFPIGVKAHFDFYKLVVLEDNDSGLERFEREYLAWKVSELNKCPYCISHHKSALEFTHTTSLSTSERLNLLEELALLVVHEPWKTPALKTKFLQSFSPSSWAHAVFVAGYFNMANRLAFAENLEVESNYQKMCQ